MSGVATNWVSTRGTLVGAGVPSVYIISLPQGNVKWILARWVFTAYSQPMDMRPMKLAQF